MRGSCLCGGVVFQVQAPPARLYQCHCSLCRRQSGAAASAAFVVRDKDLLWIAGEALISSYRKPTGFRSDFCSRCGSPVPNRMRGSSYVWVPAGLLEDTGSLEIALHLFTGSKASWEPPPPTGVVHESMPAFAEVLACLRAGRDTGPRDNATLPLP